MTLLKMRDDAGRLDQVGVMTPVMTNAMTALVDRQEGDGAAGRATNQGGPRDRTSSSVYHHPGMGKVDLRD